jgi:hypothetical protein
VKSAKTFKKDVQLIFGTPIKIAELVTSQLIECHALVLINLEEILQQKSCSSSFLTVMTTPRAKLIAFGSAITPAVFAFLKDHKMQPEQPPTLLSSPSKDLPSLSLDEPPAKVLKISKTEETSTSEGESPSPKPSILQFAPKALQSCVQQMIADLREFQTLQIIKTSFNKMGNPALFEKLEYFGDTILEKEVAEMLMKTRIFMDPGLMTSLSSHITENLNLARVFDSLEFIKFLPEEEREALNIAEKNKKSKDSKTKSKVCFVHINILG